MAGKISLVLNVLLIGAVIYLFTQVGKTPAEVVSNDPVDSINDTTNTDSELKIAYVNLDSLLINYKFSEKLNDEMIKEEKIIQGKIRYKMENLQKQMETFQSNVMAGLDPSVTTEEQFQAKMMDFQMQAENYQNDQLKKLEEKTYEMNDTLMSIFNEYLDRLVEDSYYDYIFKDGIGTSFLYRNDKYDLTEKVVSDLNKEYVAKNGEDELEETE